MSGLSKRTNHQAFTRGSVLPMVLFFGGLAVLTFLELFVTFRGLSSPMGMDQAQIAREMARGNGSHTKIVRPYTWRLYLANPVADTPPSQQADILNPPLQSILMAPVFKLLGSRMDVDSGTSRVYLPDRVVACISFFFFIGALAVSHMTVKKLFDERIAAAMALGMMLCQLLWDVTRSGLPQMLLLFLFALAMHLLCVGLEKASRDENALLPAFGIGLLGAAMVMTHWMAVWLLLGIALVVGLFFTRKGVSATLVCLPPVAALTVWALRTHAVCGDYLGAAKGLTQSLLHPGVPSLLLRDFSAANPSVALESLTRKLVVNLTFQTSDMLVHFGGAIAALLFFVSLIHAFRNQVASHFRWAVLIVWLCAAFGMAAIGLPGGAADDNQIHTLFIPLMSGYGLAFLAVLWGRLAHKRKTWWTEHGYAAVALGLSALPMVSSLPPDVTLGLHLKGEFAHWPPYLPDRIAKLHQITADSEYIFSDAPWAVAWYADRHCVWLPTDKADFSDMRRRLEVFGNPVAGFLMTPLAARGEYLGSVFTGEYKDWAPQIYRGMVMGFGMDILAQQADFPYLQIYPLAGMPVGDRFIGELLFMSDKKRWDKTNG